MVCLTPEEFEEFLAQIKEGLKHPVGPVPTPKLEQALKMIRQMNSRANKED